MNPLAELSAYLLALATRLRTRRLFAMVLEVEVIGDIAADIRRTFAAAGRKAHHAETHACEALGLLAAASAPDSPGGEMITPQERAPIERVLRTTAAAAHAAGELVTA